MNKVITAKIKSEKIFAEIEREKIYNNESDSATNKFWTFNTGAKNIKIHKTNPAILTGIRIKLSGRIPTERVKPKMTIKQKEIGAFHKTKDSILDYAMYTNKNKRGSYTVKVWTTSTICSNVNNIKNK